MSQRRSSKNRQNAPKGQAGTSQQNQATSSSTSRRAQRRIEQERNQRRQRLMMVGGGIVLAVVVVGALILLNRPDDTDDVSALGVTPAPPRDESIPSDGRTMGNPDAPVTIIEYADFQCPACGNFARTVKPQLIADYVATGKAKIVFHDFPFLDNRSDTSESDDAAEAGFCAQDQGQFWAYHDTLFNNQSGENEGAFARDRLIAMARTVEGLDVDQFTTCIDGDEFEDAVQESYNQAVANGIQSTPTFDVNGQKVTGSGYAALQQAIEEALAS